MDAGLENTPSIGEKWGGKKVSQYLVSISIYLFTHSDEHKTSSSKMMNMITLLSQFNLKAQTILCLHIHVINHTRSSKAFCTIQNQERAKGNFTYFINRANTVSPQVSNNMCIRSSDNMMVNNKHQIH